MTAEDRDTYLAERLSGTEKLQFENRCLKRREKLIKDQGSDAFLVKEAEREKAEALETARNFQNQFLQLNQNLSLIFNPSDLSEVGSFLLRQGCIWPTTVSSESYFQFVAFTVPIGLWEERPPPRTTPR